MINLEHVKSSVSFLVVIVLFIAIIGCGTDGKKYDKKFVKDTDGNVYQLEWKMGDCYFVNERKIPTKWK